MCCTQAKLALPLGGTPYCHRLSSASRSPPQSETLKGGIGEYEIRLEIGVAVVVKAVPMGNLPFDAANGEVHLREPPCRVVRLLAVDADVAVRPSAVAVAAGVRIDELDRLNEHARRAAARVVNPALSKAPAFRPGA